MIMYSLACAGSNSPYDLVFSKADAGPVQLTGWGTRGEGWKLKD